LAKSDDLSLLRRRLEAALLTLAGLVLDNSAFLPAFQRVEREIEALKTSEDAIQRAKAKAARRQSATR
jgi:hypothetical protein